MARTKAGMFQWEDKMAIAFKGNAEVMLNRHQSLGDGISIKFPNEVSVYANLGGKYSLQINGKPKGDDFLTITDAYLTAEKILNDQFEPVKYKEGEQI
jgi:hypothetical protein